VIRTINLAEQRYVCEELLSFDNLQFTNAVIKSSMHIYEQAAKQC